MVRAAGQMNVKEGGYVEEHGHGSSSNSSSTSGTKRIDQRLDGTSSFPRHAISSVASLDSSIFCWV